jgi:hypothetical protein
MENTNNKAGADPFTQGLVYQGDIALRWRPPGAAPDTQEDARLAESNEHTLRVLLALDDHGPEAGDEGGELSQNFARLEFKLNLALDMVGELLAHYHDTPAPVSVRLGALGLSWKAQQALQPQQQGWVEIYLNARYPRPVVFAARVQEVKKLPDGFEITALFGNIGAAVRELLQKIIFRHHRRSIAVARRTQS